MSWTIWAFSHTETNISGHFTWNESYNTSTHQNYQLNPICWCQYKHSSQTLYANTHMLHRLTNGKFVMTVNCSIVGTVKIKEISENHRESSILELRTPFKICLKLVLLLLKCQKPKSCTQLWLWKWCQLILRCSNFIEFSALLSGSPWSTDF